jgi:hypothetical protein
MFQNFGRRQGRSIFAAGVAAATLSLAVPEPAQAWYDIPVRASTKTLEALRAERIDIRRLADTLRTAADSLDEDAAQARRDVVRDCSRCAWSVIRKGEGAPYIGVRLKEQPPEAELDTAGVYVPNLPPVRRRDPKEPRE